MALAVVGLVYILVVYPRQTRDGAGDEVMFVVPEDASARDVASELARAGVIDDAFRFALYLRLLGAHRSLRVGQEVHLTDDLSAAEVARRVARGLGPIRVDVMIPEGFNRFDVAARLERYGLVSRERFLAATVDPEVLRQFDIPGGTAEGYLFPDTYSLRDDLTPTEMIARMVSSFRRRTNAILAEESEGAERLERELGFSLHDVLRLASVVEKEAAVADERPIIAGVFLNRLRSDTFLPRHRLQADPTVSYGCIAEPESAPSCADYRGRITRAMLRDSANRYNSYRHSGLPPTPICNPGAAAIRAVLDPAHHDYLYFVARGGRRHHFSATLDRHNEAVEEYLRGGDD